MARFKVPDRSALVRWRGRVEGLVPEDHLVRFVWQQLCDLDFGQLEAQYPSAQGGPGRTPYHPRLLTGLWIYGMSAGLETAAEIAAACVLRDDFKWLAGGHCPSDQTLLNFLDRVEGPLLSVWIGLLHAMRQAGHIDLSVIIEDGTKCRANAGPDSFRTLPEITALVERLEKASAPRVDQAEGSGDLSPARASALRARLARAKLAHSELTARIERRQERGGAAGVAPSTDTQSPPVAAPVGVALRRRRAKEPDVFGKDRFTRHPSLDVLACPAGNELRFIGEYPTDNRKGRYRLYARADCTACDLKAQCTSTRGRRVKLTVVQQVTIVEVAPATAAAAVQGDGTQPATTAETPTASKPPKPEKASRGPVASSTDPESVMMLGTSEKVWQPSFNADIAVTRAGVIVSQLLTKAPTDFHHFAPALGFVLSNVGRPENWVGDGHYGTAANIVLAGRETVRLFAPRAGSAPREPSLGQQEHVEESSPEASPAQFGQSSFRHDAEKDALICPAGNELGFLGEYPTDNGCGTYLLYGRSDCTDCPLKAQCTQARGRRVKRRASVSRPESVASPDQEQEPDDIPRLLREHDERMLSAGDDYKRLRSHTVEPTNAHLKQHGLGRFHVRGLARCATVLTLACMAHNLMKWRGKEAARTRDASCAA